MRQKRSKDSRRVRGMVEILFILQAMEVPLPDHWESILIGEEIECGGWELPKKISRRRVRGRRSFASSKTAGDAESAGFDTASTNLVPGASQQDDVSTRTPEPASSEAPAVSTDRSTDDSSKPFKKRMYMR